MARYILLAYKKYITLPGKLLYILRNALYYVTHYPNTVYYMIKCGWKLMDDPLNAQVILSYEINLLMMEALSNA